MFFNLNSYDSIFILIAVYNLYMVSIHSSTHDSFIQYYNGIFDSKDAAGPAPARYEFPAKTIGYSQFYKFSFVSLLSEILNNPWS